jgi:glycine/D-amino acid oxidase-like deaminating enzyme
MGWPVEAWDLAELGRRVPFIDKTEGLAGAVFAPKDGLVNPNRLKNHFREQARDLGVVFDDRTLLRSAERSGDGMRILTERFPTALSHEAKIEVLARDFSLETARVEYRARRVINCAGAWAPGVARILGYSCPSFPVRRQVCIFDCRDVDLTQYGMIIDPSGVYFHPEATNGLAGFADSAEPHGFNYEYDGESFFMEKIWPALFERSTAFERLKHLTGWSGLYEVSPDESAIIGEVTKSETVRDGRIFEAHSFSGHGVMHSYSAGLALAELIVKGRYETVDALILSGARFETGKLVHEGLVI